MKTKCPLISVIIPSYNHERYIGRAIESVLSQTYKNIELILVDDGSTDGTRKAIEAILKHRDPHQPMRISYYPRTNHGAENAINFGLTMARGRYLALLNSDDFYHSERIEKLVTHAERYHHDLLFTLVRYVDSEGKLADGRDQRVLWYAQEISEIHKYPTIGFALLVSNIAVTSGNFFFSRRLYRFLGGFHAFKTTHDYDFILRALNFTEPALLSEYLMYYRIHGSNTINESLERVRAESLEILRRYLLRSTRVRNSQAPNKKNWGNYFTSFICRQFSELAQYAPYENAAPIIHSAKFADWNLLKKANAALFIRKAFECRSGEEIRHLGGDDRFIGLSALHFPHEQLVWPDAKIVIQKMGSVHSCFRSNATVFRIKLQSKFLPQYFWDSWTFLIYENRVAGVGQLVQKKVDEVIYDVVLKGPFANVELSLCRAEVFQRKGSCLVSKIVSNVPLDNEKLLGRRLGTWVVYRKVAYHIAESRDRGQVDEVRRNIDGVLMRGWAMDFHTHQRPLRIIILVNGKEAPFFVWPEARRDLAWAGANALQIGFAFKMSKRELSKYGERVKIELFALFGDNSANLLCTEELSIRHYQFRSGAIGIEKDGSVATEIVKSSLKKSNFRAVTS